MSAEPRGGVPAAAGSRSGPLRRLRRGADWLHLALTALIVVAVFVQVYLIGAYIFGAGTGALDAHKSAGFVAHGFEVAQFVFALVAWLSRTDVALSFALAVIGTVQVALADSTKWVGGLHPLLALVVLTLAVLVTRRGIRRHRSTAAAPAV